MIATLDRGTIIDDPGRDTAGQGLGVIGIISDSVRRYGSLLRAVVRPPPGRRWPTVRRMLVVMVFVPAFTAVQLGHALCLLLDEILFPAYRRVAVSAPVFVLGVPRSGTTLVHRVLARDDALTTFKTWECLLAPSILQRKVILAAARLDRAVGRPLARFLGLIERAVFASLDDVHAMDLGAPEEDYLALLPVMACFILVVPFPGAERLWRLATVDRDMPPAERRRLMAVYRGLLQRHLYVHGPDRRLLSKNAAFAGMAGALMDTFPDALVLRCHREPDAVVPSQLSAIQGGVRLFDSDPDGTLFTPRMTEVLRAYYANLARTVPAQGGPRHMTVTMDALKGDLGGTIRAVYAHFGLPVSATFAARLDEEAGMARRYRSAHRYDARDFGLDQMMIARLFGPVQDQPVQTGAGQQGGG